MKETHVYIAAEIKAVIDLYSDLINSSFYQMQIMERLRLLAERLFEAHGKGNTAVCFQIGSWHPQWVGKSRKKILNDSFSLDDAQLTLARDHGFAGWEAVVATGDTVYNKDFEMAVDVLLSGDLVSLKELVSQKPDLISAQSKYGHRATLLHYTGSNGVETYRQVVPMNLVEITEFLISTGVDTELKANIYGGSTAYELCVTSAHPKKAGIIDSVTEVYQKLGKI